MEHQLWKRIVAVMKVIAKPRNVGRCTFTNEDIVLVWFWSVLHDRPVSWACKRSNWPICLRRRKLPSSSTMSRRLVREGQVRGYLVGDGNYDSNPLHEVCNETIQCSTGDASPRRTW